MSDADLQQALGMMFNDTCLLQSAFVHRSFLHEHPERVTPLTSNERLEFLGDAVLNFLTAAWLYEQFPEHSEGALTNLRAGLVKTTTLARFARTLNLGDYVRMSRGEDTPAGRNRAPLLADVFEAVVGALYLDQDLEAVRRFVLPFLQQELELIKSGNADIDYRTRLQERLQAQYGITPTYQIVRVDGPDHQREFTTEVRMGDDCLGVGSGPSKQAAAQAAARAALTLLDDRAAATA